MTSQVVTEGLIFVQANDVVFPPFFGVLFCLPHLELPLLFAWMNWRLFLKSLPEPGDKYKAITLLTFPSD